jgi:hypothetical protein
MKTCKDTTKITDSDLIHNKNKYDISILEKNVQKLDKKLLLCNQILNAEFCVKYIYDDNIDSGSEDSYIYDMKYILDRQPHITEEEFNKAFNLFFKKK